MPSELITYKDGTKKWFLNGKLIKLLYDKKEYKNGYDPCQLCIVKTMCKIKCELKQLLIWS